MATPLFFSAFVSCPKATAPEALAVAVFPKATAPAPVAVDCSPHATPLPSPVPTALIAA